MAEIERNWFIFIDSLCLILIYVGYNQENAMSLYWAVEFWKVDVEEVCRKDIIFHLAEQS